MERNLPPIECFYSSLKSEGISQENYNHAQSVFNTMNLRNLGEWSDVSGINLGAHLRVKNC